MGVRSRVIVPIVVNIFSGRIISRTGTHAAFRGTYMRRLHAFLEESYAESVRRHHRRCAREMAARMSQSSGRDSADGTADVSTRCTVTRRTVCRAQRPRKSVRGARSSRASDTVSLPQSEAHTVQSLMDLTLPRFVGLGYGPRQVHEPWAISADSPASPATSHLDTSGEEDRRHVLTWMDVNCRNCELYNVCDISMWCNMDLTMYSNIYEDCVVNPRMDKC